MSYDFTFTGIGLVVTTADEIIEKALDNADVELSAFAVRQLMRRIAKENGAGEYITLVHANAFTSGLFHDETRTQKVNLGSIKRAVYIMVQVMKSSDELHSFADFMQNPAFFVPLPVRKGLLSWFALYITVSL